MELGDLVLGEILFKEVKRLANVVFDGSLADLQSLGNISIGQALVSAHLEDVAALAGELGD